MKKIYILMFLLILLFITGCNNNKIKDIEAEEIIACVDTFNITEYTFTVIYTNDTNETVNMLPIMFSNEDINKFYEVGTHQVILNYEGFSKTITITLEERKAISLKANPSTINSYINEFKYEMITLEILYNDNTSDFIPFSRNLLDSKDIIALSKPGTYDILVKYEDVSTTIHFELLPNETKIENLPQDVIIYCLTTKENDKYASTFYVLANKEFSGLQFKITYSPEVKIDNIVIDLKNIICNSSDDYVTVMYSASQNITGTLKLFTIYFTSENQYHNFNLDYNFNKKIVYINTEKEVVDIDNYLFTFTR